MHEPLASLFRRAEPRQRSLAYLKGLVGTVERKNGWQLAEWIGEATPDGVQHLLERAQWELDAIAFSKDESPELSPIKSDLDTAQHLGRRVAKLTQYSVAGRG